MAYQYWRVDYPHAISTVVDYDLYIPANEDWIAHLSEKRWAHEGILDELAQILNQHQGKVAA